jgi:hypothetical protein
MVIEIGELGPGPYCIGAYANFSGIWKAIMTLSRAVATKNAESDATMRLLDGGTIKIYSGTVPATADTALAGNTLLVTITIGNPSAPASSGGVGTFNAFTAGTAGNTGTATFFRAVSSGAATVLQGSVTATGGGGDLTLPTVTINSGDTVNVNTSGTYTES